MSSQESLVASKVRLNEWAMQVRECKERPVGMKVDDWCEEHGITPACYYYRLRRVRKALLESVSAPKEQTAPSFVEISIPSSSDPTVPQTAALVTIGSSTMEISDHASKEFLINLIGAMKSC